MSFKSMIQDMKGELGSISRRGFEGRFGYGMKSRSQRVVEDFAVSGVDALRQSCWANMPPELLRDVLMRIEESECAWPPRKNVVSCAGVCRSWRDTMKEIVRTLEVSEKLTFPISLKQARTVGQCGFSCGLFAAIFSFSHCGLERYRRKKDWVNTLTAGAVAGAAFGAGTRNWKQVACFTGLFLSFFQLAKDSRSV